MRKLAVIIPAVTVTTLLVATGGVFAYDGARPDAIAKGITVGGIDVGGLRPAAARTKLDRELIAGLQRPIVVHHATSSWTLGAKEARIRTNVDAMVTEAVARSQKGGVLGRTTRRLTGGTVAASLQPAVTYSDAAVIRMVDKVRRGVGRPAQDASVTLTGSGVKVQQGERGLKVDATALHQQIDKAIVDATGARTFVAQTAKVAPKVSTAQLAKKDGTVLIANREANTLKLYKDLKLVKTYGVAAGQPAYPTPAGEFKIVNKAVNPTWSVPKSAWAGSLGGSVVPGGSPANPLKARWMGITDGVGIHGTADDGSIGSNASHGCLRMHVADVIDLYPRVPVGTRILIV